jgi:hypothetical protein
VPAHAVGDGVATVFVVDEKGVLVVGADEADVGDIVRIGQSMLEVRA